MAADNSATIVFQFLVDRLERQVIVLYIDLALHVFPDLTLPFTCVLASQSERALIDRPTCNPILLRRTSIYIRLKLTPNISALR